MILARDLGPEGNTPLVEAHPDARLVVLGTPEPGDPRALVPYGDAMRELWGSGP